MDQYYDATIDRHTHGEYRIVGHRPKKIYVNFKDGFVRKYTDNSPDCSGCLYVNYTNPHFIEIVSRNSPIAIFNIDSISCVEIAYDDITGIEFDMEGSL